MRILRGIWHLLSAAGNVSLVITYGPVVVVVLVAVAGRVLDQPVLFLAAIGIGLLSLAVVCVNAWRQRSPKSKGGLGPKERREHIDNLFYPPRDDRLELGEECAAFAMKIDVINEELEWKRERSVARSIQQIREAEPELDPFEARERAEAHFKRYMKSVYAKDWRDNAVDLFNRAREMHAIAENRRHLAESPHAVEIAEIPHMFRAMARRLGFEPLTESASTNWPSPPSLASELDDFAREGVALVSEMDAPVVPEQVEGGWKLEASPAPDEWWEKADGFAQRIRTLLLERHPVLLKDYADGYNAHLRKEHKERREAKSEPDTRSDAEKMLDLANWERSGPRRVIEASLDGLHAARHRIGSAPVEKLSS